MEFLEEKARRKGWHHGRVGGAPKGAKRPRTHARSDLGIPRGPNRRTRNAA
jgi:hypothetical protein